MARKIRIDHPDGEYMGREYSGFILGTIQVPDNCSIDDIGILSLWRKFQKTLGTNKGMPGYSHEFIPYLVKNIKGCKLADEEKIERVTLR